MKGIMDVDKELLFGEAEGAMEALADAMKHFGEAIHEFATEADTKEVKRAVRGVEDAAREHGVEAFGRRVSASWAACDGG